MGVSVSTGMTYLQQPGLQQLLTCLADAGTPRKTQTHDILNSDLNNIVLYFIALYYMIFISRKIVAFYCNGLQWSHCLFWSKLLHYLLPSDYIL